MDADLDNPAVTLDKHLPGSLSWKQKAQKLHTEAHVFYLVFKHPRTPWHARVVAACSVGYLFSPVQLIPSFIPVIGFLDDALVLFFGAKLLRKITPADVLVECREVAGVAETRRNERASTIVMPCVEPGAQEPVHNTPAA